MLGLSEFNACWVGGSADQEFSIKEAPVNLDANYNFAREVFEKLPLIDKVAFVLLHHPKWQYRTAHGIARELEVTFNEVQDAIEQLIKDKLVVVCPHHDGQFGHVGRLPKMEMSKEEKSIKEALLWEKARPLDPNMFVPIDDYSSGESPLPTDSTSGDTMCESASEGFAMSANPRPERQRHLRHMRDLVMLSGYLPENLIVKAITDAMMHAREVSEREHIKADRIERTNQFIVSLRRQLGYMDDKYRTEREFISANLTNKEVWYDIGVLNPERVAGLRNIPYATVQRWVLQAQAGMGSTVGSLQDAIDKTLTGLKGTILVAQGCNLVTDQLNKDADKVVSEMAAIAADL